MMEEMLRVILKDDNLRVVEVVVQNSIKNLQGRSVRLDALCIRGNGRPCNIEVEKSNDKHHLKRVRYNASCITANIIEPGEKFENVPDIDMVYISAFDLFKLGRVIYHVEPTILEADKVIDNELHEVYVNTEIQDESDISELMQCFLQTEVNNKKFPKLAQRIDFLKHNDEGVKYMCEISDEIREEGRAEGRAEERKKAIVNMLKKLTIEDIIDLGYDRQFVLQVINAI